MPTANGTVEGADTQAGAGILNFINIYIQQTPILLILFIILGFGIEILQLYMNDYCPNCQFAGLTHSPMFWYYRVLKRPALELP